MPSNPIGIAQGLLLTPEQARGCFTLDSQLWKEEFAAASLLGLECVELCFGARSGSELHAHPLIALAGIDAIRSVIAETGVRVLSVRADFFAEFPVHREHSDTDTALEVLDRLLSSCSKIGARDLVIPLAGDARPESASEIDRLISIIGRSMGPAITNGVNLSLKTDLPPDRIAGMLRRFDSPAVTITYDSGASAGMGLDLDREFDAYGPFISVVHLSDSRRDGELMPLGEGAADFRTLIAKLRRERFSGPFIINSTRREEGAEIETVRGYIEFARKLTR